MHPASKPENWPLSKIVPYPGNPRSHPAEQITLLAKLMLRHGVDQPIVVDEAGVIIKGHGRRLAAIEAGFASFPVVIHRGLSDADKRAMRVQDNQIQLLSSWDEDILRMELTELSIAGYDMPLLGFDNVHLVQFMANAPSGADPEETPDPPADPVTRTGDIWLMGKHRLICGDSTDADDVARVLDGHKPNLMVTDPPYGVDYDPNWRNEADRANGKPYGGRAVGLVTNDKRSDWSETWALFTGNILYCWHPAGANSVDFYHSIIDSGFQIRMQIIWSKSHFPIGRGDYHVQHEPCWYAVRKGKPGNWCGDRKQTTIWEIDKPAKSETGHSTQKPVECMRRPIQNNSKPGEYVYEPFSGSGTTIIAAEMMNRYCLAIEISPTYVDVAVRRWQAFAKADATLAGDGRTFADLEQERHAKLVKKRVTKKQGRRKH